MRVIIGVCAVGMVMSIYFLIKYIRDDYTDGLS